MPELGRGREQDNCSAEPRETKGFCMKVKRMLEQQ